MSERTYTELMQYSTLEDRFRYLSLGGRVGDATFGYDRWMNQDFYRSREWRLLRHEVIVRDESCDLAVPGFEIYDKVYIHHMNPLTKAQLLAGDEAILDPEFLISTTHRTHNAIHYGDEGLLPRPFVERRQDDHILWKRLSKGNA